MTQLAIIGLGYVGLPLAQAAINRGIQTVGLDTSRDVVNGLNAGHSHVDDLTDADVNGMLQSGFRATTDEMVLREADTIVVCVPTPLGEGGGPDLSMVKNAAETISRNLTRGALVLLESTTWPGTTEEFFRPILESSGLTAGRDFNLAFSPERIDPGNARFNIVNTPKVVGGVSDSCSRSAREFYSQIVDSVVLASGTREAEMAKLLENTYRQVNIALVNEMAKFSHELGIDIWDVIRCAASKPFGYEPFYPGPGVGGHCIPIDPSYLSYQVQARLGYPFRFVELAQEVNRSMPRYVVDRAAACLNHEGKAVRGSRILLLGVTYKPGIADQRESPAVHVAELLLRRGALVDYYDPYVAEWVFAERRMLRADLEEATKKADLVIHLQTHHSYNSERMASIECPILDTRGVLTGETVTHL